MTRLLSFLLLVSSQIASAQGGTRPDSMELTLPGLEKIEQGTDVGTYERYFYRDLILHVGPDGGYDGWTVVSTPRRTRRGLGVDDSISRAIEMYGPPDVRADGELRWRLQVPRGAVMVATAKAGLVTSIFAGFPHPKLSLTNGAYKPCAPTRSPVSLWSNEKGPGGSATFVRSQDGRALDVTLKVSGLPTPSTFGPYMRYIAWVALPSLERFERLGEIENNGVLEARTAFRSLLFLVSAESDSAGDRWRGPILLSGRCG